MSPHAPVAPSPPLPLTPSRSRRQRPRLATVVLALTAGLAVACQPTDRVTPGWEWSMDSVMRTVNQVRAGRDLNPEAWPGGARVAVLLSFDVDNETIPLRFGEPTISDLSRGEYGARVGLPRVLALLDEYDIPASFFIPAVSLMISPEMVDAIQEAGHHEFAVHGYIHELNSSLDRETERDLLVRATDYLTEVVGERPVGYRAPSWNFSPYTLELLRELGFLYDSSMMADERPYELMAGGEATGMVELPVEWIMDDAPLFYPRGDAYSSPRDVLQVWKDEFDVAYDEGTMFILTMHPHYIGHRSRIVVLRELIEHIRQHDDVWWATHADAASYAAQQAGM